MRKQEIKNYIERSFEDHWKQNSMPDLPIGEKVRESVIQLPDIVHSTTTVAPELFSSDYTERVQSFFPECKFVSDKLENIESSYIWMVDA